MDYGGLNPAQEQPKRERGPITVQVATRQKLQATLEDAISKLQSRLSPILSPENAPPSPINGQAGLQKAEYANHAQELANANQHLEHLIGWITNITNRIEL